MADASDKARDNLIRHAVDLERFKGASARRVRRFLEKLQGSIINALAGDDPTVPSRTEYQRNRLRKLNEQIKPLVIGTYAEVQRAQRAELRRLAAIEAEAALGFINQAVGIDMANVTLTTELLQAIVDDAPVEGVANREWWGRQSATLRRRFSDQMAIGVSRGEALGDLVKRTRSVMGVAARDAEALARTAAQSVSNAARVASYEANDDVVKGYVHLSTLDSRTSDICMARSGLVWDLNRQPVGHSHPYQTPPLHWQCRSTMGPWLKGYDELSSIKPGEGNRRDKDAFIDAEVEKRVGALRAKKPDWWTPDRVAAYKASARQRIQDSLTGGVPRDLNYQEWLKALPQGRQDAILGPTKAKLFRDGKITTRDLVDSQGRTLTISQLEAKVRGKRRK